MERIELKIFALIISIFVLLSNINSSYARYLSESTGTADIDFSTWKVLVNNTDITNSTVTNMIITPTIISNSNVRNGTLAPGSIGYFDLMIDCSNVETSFNYQISINKTGEISNLKVIGYSPNNTSTTPSVSYKNTTDNEFESGCISNETGRCVLPYQGKDRSIDLLYQQNGMQTKLDTVEVSNEKVINTVLTPGKTLDVLVYSDKLGKKIPEEATVLINQKPARKIGKGFYSYNFFNAKTKTVSLKVQSPIGTKLQKIDTSKGSKVVTVSLENKKKK